MSGDTPDKTFTVVSIETSVPMSVDHVWSRIGSFFDLGRWLDVECSAVCGEGKPGSIRRVGETIIEPLVAATRRSYTYMQTEGPMASLCYHGTVACEPQGEAGSQIVYTLVYDHSSMDEDRRAAERERLTARFRSAVDAMRAAVMA